MTTYRIGDRVQEPNFYCDDCGSTRHMTGYCTWKAVQKNKQSRQKPISTSTSTKIEYTDQELDGIRNGEMIDRERRFHRNENS